MSELDSNGSDKRRSWRDRRHGVYRVDPKKIEELEENPPKRPIDELEKYYGEVRPTRFGAAWTPFKEEKDRDAIHRLEASHPPHELTLFEKLEVEIWEGKHSLDDEKRDFEQREQEAVQAYLDAFLKASANNTMFSDDLSLGKLGSTLPGEGIAHSEGGAVNPSGSPEDIILNVLHITPDGHPQLAAQTKIHISEWKDTVPLTYQKSYADFTGSLFSLERMVGIMEQVTEHLSDPTGMGIDRK